MTFAKYLMVVGAVTITIGTLFISANILETIQVPSQAKSGNVITGMVLLVIGIYLLLLSYFEK